LRSNDRWQDERGWRAARRYGGRRGDEQAGAAAADRAYRESGTPDRRLNADQ
jgi:hypothetical protein